jgi:N-terminal domain of toast_rack, DUF2154
MAKRLLCPALVLGSLLLTTASCDYEQVETGPTREVPVSIDKGSVDHANIELDMGAGELAVSGGASKLVDGRFEFNIASGEPTVRSSVTGTHATITIQQPKGIHVRGHQRYRWNLDLNDKVLTDLAINCGAGQARLKLGELALRTLTVHMGAGQVDLDLEGTPSRDYDVDISGGVGQATVRLPRNVGIRAEAHGGIGQIDVTGLEKRGDYYQNNLWDNGKVNVRLKVQGGIGEIKIIG